MTCPLAVHAWIFMMENMIPTNLKFGSVGWKKKHDKKCKTNVAVQLVM